MDKKLKKMMKKVPSAWKKHLDWEEAKATPLKAIEMGMKYLGQDCDIEHLNYDEKTGERLERDIAGEIRGAVAKHRIDSLVELNDMRISKIRNP